MNPLCTSAEILAVPFTSVDLFRQATLYRTPATAVAVQLRLRRYRAAPHAIDLLDTIWPSASSAGFLLDLRAHARNLLQSDGQFMVPVVDRDEPCQEILRWRWITLALPASLLAAFATPPGVPPLRHVRLLHPNIAPLGETAHLHVHLKASLDFETLWTHLAAGDRWHAKLAEAPEGVSTDEWPTWLLHAFLARRALSQMLREGMILNALVRSTSDRNRVQVERALRSLVMGAPQGLSRFEREGLAGLVFALTSPRKRVRTHDDVFFNDPIDDATTWPEGQLLARGLERVERDGPGQDFEKLLLQYLRVKCMLYRHLTHDPAESGLDAFDRTFRRLGPYRKGLESILPDLAFDEPGLELAAVEVRLTPDTMSKVALDAQQLRRKSATHEHEAGIVYHLTRANDDGPPRSRAAFRRLFGNLRRQANIVRNALEWNPFLLDTIRGLDLAGLERDGPLWLAAPFLHELHERSILLGAKVGLPPLRLTLHVGEDFGHLASGLRAISEPFDWRLITRGDRLGHARALGVDVERWCREHPCVPVRRWARMLDLAWMLATLADSSPPAEPGIDAQSIFRAKDEAHRHLRSLGVEDASEQTLVQLYRDVLSDHRRIPSIIEGLLTPPSTPAFQLFRRHVEGDPVLHEVIEIPTVPDIGWMLALQKTLLRRLSRWHTAIEINPSSNLVIGARESFLDQPHFRIHPLDGHDTCPPPVTINTDDPLTFATSLGDEFAYTWAGIVIDGRETPARARSWLQEAANAAWRARFTLPPR